MIKKTTFKMCQDIESDFEIFTNLILILHLPIEEYLRRVNLFENDLKVFRK